MAAILRYLYLKTAKMQHKSVKKSVICVNRNISKLPLQFFLLIQLIAGNSISFVCCLFVCLFACLFVFNLLNLFFKKQL